MGKEVQVACTEGCIGWTEEKLDQRLLTGSLAHEAAGMEEVSTNIREQAGELFARGQDDTAHIWREIADQIDARAKDRRAEQKKYEKEFGE